MIYIIYLFLKNTNKYENLNNILFYFIFSLISIIFGFSIKPFFLFLFILDFIINFKTKKFSIELKMSGGWIQYLAHLIFWIILAFFFKIPIDYDDYEKLVKKDED